MLRTALAMLVIGSCNAMDVQGNEDTPQQPLSAAEALLSTARAQLELDELDAARASFLDARKLLKARPRARLELSVLLGLADVELKQGEYVGASDWLEEAERLWQEIGDPAAGARLWTARAGIAFRQRRTGEALQHRLAAVELARRAGDSELLFQTLTNLARAYLDLHDFPAAIPLFLETAGLEARPLDRVVNQIQLGISQFELNQFDSARRSFEAAREAAAELGSPRLEGVALGELGLVAWEESHDAERATAYYDRAIEKLAGIGDRVNVAVWRSNKALVLRDSGQFEAALSLYRELEAELQAIEGQQVWPTVYKGKAQCEFEIGRFDQARATIDQCLDAAHRGGDSKRIWECEQLRGRLSAASGDFDTAREAYEAAVAEIERLRVSLLVGRFKADFFEDKLGVYQEYAALLAAHLPAAHAARATFEVSERARARAFLDEFARADGGHGGAVPDEMLQREERILQELRKLRAEGAGNGPIAVEAARLEAELDALTMTARRHLALPARGVRASTLEEIQGALAPGEHMLVYWLADPASYLWRIDRQSIEHHELASAKRLEAEVRAAYVALGDPAKAVDFGPLSKTLLGPLLGGGIRQAPLLIVPSGILHYFPFETLPLQDGSLLSDRASTSYLPSASALVHLRRQAPHNGPPAMLAVGDVPYVAAGAGTHPAAMGSLGPLPFSGPEVEAVRSRFGYRAVDLLTGGAAQEGRLKAMPLNRYSVLHFATHGWIDPASHSASGLVLLPGEGPEDGLLQVREIRPLELDAELVILSACQSALGRLVTGEGMVGLTRAFLDAGARSVVASLWNVNDQASAEFMDEFYVALAGGASRAEALHEARARLRARAEYSHPHYWAAWVLTGDGADGVAFPVRWERWALLGLGVLLLGAFAAWRWNQRN